MKKIEVYEPYFFLFFGIFHLHRIWGLIDRKSYAAFWVNVMESKGMFYFVLMGTLGVLCILGIHTFFRNLHYNYWWRWIYLFGGSYVLFDLFAVATGWTSWKNLILAMYDTDAWYWNVLWVSFIILGVFVFLLGIYLLNKGKVMKKEKYELKKLKKLQWIILFVIILLCMVCLCIKMYPRSLNDIIHCDKKNLTNIACSMSVCELNNDAKSFIKQYELQPLEKGTQEFDEIADILYSTTYISDLRNLLPWTMTSVEADGEYDGITANIILTWGNDAADSCYISFLGENLVSVSLSEEDGFFIFHPSDTEVFNELVTYIKLYGTEK